MPRHQLAALQRKLEDELAEYLPVLEAALEAVRRFVAEIFVTVSLLRQCTR